MNFSFKLSTVQTQNNPFTSIPQWKKIMLLTVPQYILVNIRLSHLSQRARSWLLPAFTNIILALKSNCFMMSISSPASTSGLLSPWDNLQQCSISWWPHTMLSLCRLRMAIHREELGAWQFEERQTNIGTEVVHQVTAYIGLSPDLTCS